jgi:acetoin utilization deacetylase AcuC-like enzyme
VLPPWSGDEPWVEAVTALAAWAAERGARGLVVALGVDAAQGDPHSQLQVTPPGFRAAGRVLGALGLPTVLVQEGGYVVPEIGEFVCEVLVGIEEGLNE